MISTAQLTDVFGAIWVAFHALASMPIVHVDGLPITMYTLIFTNFMFMILGMIIRTIFIEPRMAEIRQERRKTGKKAYGKIKDVVGKARMKLRGRLTSTTKSRTVSVT